MAIDVKPDTMRDREWLIATGDGGYALGTVSGIATRRYHGHLVVALPPPIGRVMVWPRTEEILDVAGRRVGLRQGWYAGGVRAPSEFVAPTSFEFSGDIATWRFEVEGAVIERTFSISAGVARLGFRLVEGRAATLRIRPLLTWRSHHHLQDAQGAVPEQTSGTRSLRWRRDSSCPWVELTWDGEVFDEDAHVYSSAWLPTETERGYDDVEDLFAPIGVEMRLGKAPMGLTVNVVGFGPSVPLQESAGLEARSRATFVIKHPDGRDGIIAGYPWFTEWGRDTMIALPGLLLPERPELARDILMAWSARLHAGLLPCQLHDTGSGPLHTNTADAPLRMIQAVAALEQVAPELVSGELSSAVDEILDAYHDGTLHGIGVGDDGLLRAGEEGHALTWMDAVAPDGPVTPRRGKPIDLNGLYLLGMRFGAERADARGDVVRAALLRDRGQTLAAAMPDAFVDRETWLIRDVADPEDPLEVEPLRPNVCVALAIEDIPWPEGVRRATLDAVDAALLTPYGLRTLSPSHPDYVARYEGDQPRRDRAYHQGTVWPWLIGAWVDATLAVRGNTPAVRARVRDALSPLMCMLRSSGSLAEVHDGEAPHAPGGCPAQAWSVAEVLRAWGRVADSKP